VVEKLGAGRAILFGFSHSRSLALDTYLQNRYPTFMLISDMGKNPDRRDLFSGALDLMILHSLRLKPMHGYALARHIKQASDDLLQIEEGSLYPALQRLLREGLLESEEGVSAKGRPTRIYRLTSAGIRQLEREVSSFEKMFTGITRVLAVAALQEG
jgi:transcriptional regulator